MLLLLFVTIRTQIKRMGMAQNLYTFLVEELGFVGCVLDPCLLIRRTSKGLEINWNAAAGCLFFQHGATCSIIKDTTRTSFLIAFLKAFLNALLKLS